MLLRKNETIRKMISETQLKVENLIMPFFVTEGINIKKPIKCFPKIFHLSIDNLLKEIEEIDKLNIPAILIFGVSGKKDKIGSYSWSKSGIVQKAVKEIKLRFPEIILITDVCLCGYKSDGHCGIFKGSEIDINLTLKYLSKIALSHSDYGADFVAPSAMMAGQVKAIRNVLNKNGFNNVGILDYSAKFASNFYGPFRESLNSNPKFGDRKMYQLDYSNTNAALKRMEESIKEGADIIMIKPALAYLDIIKIAKQKFNVPIAAYNVSGEYSMVKFGSEKHIFNEKNIILEILTAIKRAGADLIITYHAKDVARWLKK
ncbi:MAG: delta-aminolevulinic acid dehydratase [Elusimicrobia bacterium RIFOXYD2_FULL_34_30]|nr:MAG: delta-aminolevulinic acid dehydratase [Elusimicrobia bacterium RIFOXYD2_FULL_34_30]